jgi:hypothetical protein
LARHARHRLFPPQSRRLLSERRLRDWVALLGFDVDSVQGYLGALPLAGSLSAAPRPRRPLWAGAYLLKARKRLPTLTLLRPRLRTRQRVRVGAAEPTTKVGP